VAISEEARINLATTPGPSAKIFERFLQKTTDNYFGRDIILYETIVSWVVNYVW